MLPSTTPSNAAAPSVIVLGVSGVGAEATSAVEDEPIHQRKQARRGPEQLQGKKNEVTSRHRGREKENDQGEGSLTIHDHSTTRGRRLELANVLAGSVAVVKLLPRLLLGVASPFSQPGILRPSSVLAGELLLPRARRLPPQARRKQDRPPERLYGRETLSIF